MTIKDACMLIAPDVKSERNIKNTVVIKKKNRQNKKTQSFSGGFDEKSLIIKECDCSGTYPQGEKEVELIGFRVSPVPTFFRCTRIIQAACFPTARGFCFLGRTGARGCTRKETRGVTMICFEPMKLLQLLKKNGCRLLKATLWVVTSPCQPTNQRPAVS